MKLRAEIYVLPIHGPQQLSIAAAHRCCCKIMSHIVLCAQIMQPSAKYRSSRQFADRFEYEEEDAAPKAKAKAKPAARKRTESAPKKPANGTKARKRPAARDDDTDEDEDADTDEDKSPKKKKKRPAADTGGGPLLSPEMQAFLGVQRMNRFLVTRVGLIWYSVILLPKAWPRGIDSRGPFCSA